ncbi:NAD-dependent epimerase/dehydratase family protein [Mucilaginibacter sp. AW1-3]
MEKILVTGACGQLGTELVPALRMRYGKENVIASDRYPMTEELVRNGPYVRVDVLNPRTLNSLMKYSGITQVYHLAAVLSANGEQDPLNAWDLNMQSLLNVLEAARKRRKCRVFWPSSIAVFGPASPRAACPQQTILEPASVYGISKAAGELWCQYYHQRYGLDVRSLRYPGLISYSAAPGGGTTDYAVDIFHQALDSAHYTCFLKPDTCLPMLYMPDAVRATLELMEAENIGVRTSYNLWGMSFSPRQIADEIRKHIGDFSVGYAPDFRQQIADSWPASIDDRQARRDWGWSPRYDLPAMVSDMLTHLKAQQQPEMAH